MARRIAFLGDAGELNSTVTTVARNDAEAERAVEIVRSAEDASRQLAKAIGAHEGILLTGACLGFPYRAALEASAWQNPSIGFSPSTCREQHMEEMHTDPELFTELLYLPDIYANTAFETRLLLRDVMLVDAADGCISCGGRSGAYHEILAALKMGKPVGVLQLPDSPVAWAQTHARHLNTLGTMFSDTDPDELVRRLFETFSTSAESRELVSHEPVQ